MQVSVRIAIEAADSADTPRMVLVLTDDRSWRTAVRRVLEQEGYGVLTARHAGEALVACIRHDGPIHVVLADAGAGNDPGLASLTREKPEMRSLVVNRRVATGDDLLAAIRRALAPAPADHQPRA